MNQSDKIIQDFTDLMQSMVDSGDESAKHSKETVAMTTKQLKVMEGLLSGSMNAFQAEKVGNEKILESFDSAEDYNDKMMKMEEAQAELSEEQLMAQLSGFGGMEDTLSDVVKSIDGGNEEDRKDRKKSEKKGTKEFGEAKDAFRNSFDFLAGASGVDALFSLPSTISGAISSELSGFAGVFGSLVAGPIMGLGKLGMGIGKKLFGAGNDSSPSVSGASLIDSAIENVSPSILAKEGAESAVAEESGIQLDQLALLQSIAVNTGGGEDEMLKGGSLMDYLKGILGHFSIPKGVGGAMGGMMAKAAGFAMIAGGLYLAYEDFMEGFEKEGLKGGLYQAFAGKVGTGLSGQLKNGGKWALIGGGIGLVFGGPVGLIAGGMIGMAVGMTINALASIFATNESTGSKISESIFGKSTGGFKEAIAVGGRWALAGALIGLPFGGPVGMIIGGTIGFVVGMLMNFLNQIIDPSVKTAFFTVTEVVWDAYKAMFGFFYDVGKMIWDFNVAIVTGIYKVGKFIVNAWWDAHVAIIDGFMWLMDKIGIGKYLRQLGNWVGDKLSMAYDATTTFLGEQVDVISSYWGEVLSPIWQFMKDLKDSFVRVMKGYGDRIKGFFGFGGDDGTDTPPAPGTKDGVPPIVSGTTTPQEAQASAKKNDIAITEMSKTVQVQTPVQVEKLESMGGTMTTMNKELARANNFLHNVLISSVEEVLVKQFNNLILQMKLLNEQNRQWEYSTANADSLSGYGKKYAGFADELKKLDRGQEKRDYQKGYNQVNTNHNNTVNNVVETFEKKRLKRD